MLKVWQKFVEVVMGVLIDFVRKYSGRRPYIHGKRSRVLLGKRTSLLNTVINVSSGNVAIGDDTIFGHNCVLATGIHEFEGGMRKKLYHRKNFNLEVAESPEHGHDIKIGSGCWITTNVTIIGGVTIGDNVIITAGSVVTKDLPSSVIAGGVPAKILKNLASE
ncbi:MAG: acetyltransferase-like isoleucine patch superfamily enzyme [Candidatus Azotimanducaceae bacterium]|jgi:acetyltransferase-like isoleucine patch superfamily enzyme